MFIIIHVCARHGPDPCLSLILFLLFTCVPGLGRIHVGTKDDFNVVASYATTMSGLRKRYREGINHLTLTPI